MSYIDSFKHEIICKFNYTTLSGEKSWIPVYRLLEETNNSDFYAIPGEFVIGGGSGEHDGLVINIYDALSFLNAITDEEWFKKGNISADNTKRIYSSDMNKWSPESIYSKSRFLGEAGFDLTKHDNIRNFLTINLAVFLYEKFRLDIDLPKVDYEIPTDEALLGKYVFTLH